MPSCSWWEDQRQYFWQHPDRGIKEALCSGGASGTCDHGCGTGCVTCNNSQGELFQETGVTRHTIASSPPPRYMKPHRFKESRDAAGDPNFRLVSFTPHRVPLTWNGHLAQCHRDDVPDEAIEDFLVDVCDPIGGCSNHSCQNQSSGFLSGLQGEENLYYGNLWPVTAENGSMRCNSRTTTGHDLMQVSDDPEPPPGEDPPPRVRDEPYEVRLRSEWPAMRRIATVRTGHNACTSNMAVGCWGQRESNHQGAGSRAKCRSLRELEELGQSPPVGLTYYINDRIDTHFHYWDYLTVTALTARFKTPSVESPYVDAATVDAKNAALEFVDRGIRNDDVLGLRQLSPAIRAATNGALEFSVKTNATLPVFRAEFNADRSMAWPTLPAVTTFPLTHLRHRRAILRDVEYVILTGKFEVDLILHRRKTRATNDRGLQTFPNLDLIWPILRAKLTLNMGVRTRGLAAPAELRGVSVDVQDRPYFYPRLTPAGADEVVYRDALGRWLVPPPVIEVDLDYGPFGASEWKELDPTNVLSDARTNAQRCQRWATLLKNVVPLCERTNQHHADACQVFDTATGMMFRVKEYA